MNYVAVMLGGALGSLLRYVVGNAVIRHFPTRFPLATLLVNTTGCFLVGAIMPMVAHKHNWRLLLVVGFLGGYTTFSAFAYETYVSRPWTGLLNILASVALGYFAVWLGSRR